ncbi:MAG: NAD-dependent epimerase/dehydratase family protein [Candidatus Dormibacteria bacterium]
MTVAPKRVLITGVSRFWGAELAARLEADPDVEQIVAIDSEGPARELARTDVIRADLRHRLIGKLIRDLGINTVIHAGLIVDPRGASGRRIHESNVIGTMNLMAACSGPDSPVRQLVVKSSTAIYGSEPDDPSFFSESMQRRSPARDSITRSIDEFENYIRDFSLRRADTTVTVLRFANVLGIENDTPFASLFDLPVVPTVFGFDPRLQFIHEDDAVAAMEHAVRANRPGVFNVGGDGIVVLSQAVAMLGKVNAPVLPFIAPGLAVAALQRLGLVDFPPHLARLLQYGRVVDTTAMRDELGFTPGHTTLETVADYARRLRVRNVVDPDPYTYEADLERLLRSKARRLAGATTSSRARAPRRTRKPASTAS